MAPRKKKTPDEIIQNAVASIVVDSEYRTAAADSNLENIEFDALIDLLEGRRSEKDYDWMSDDNVPEFISILLTDASGWANQYFPTRDFVEAKLDGEEPIDVKKAEAAKKLINKTLNERELYYFHKYMRIRTINSLGGKGYIVAWWEQEKKPKKVIVKKPQVAVEWDDIGNAIPRVDMVDTEIDDYDVLVDRFNFDVFDPRNVFTDNRYCYSIQQKDWITVRSETSYDELKAKEEKNEYFNLDKVKEALKAGGKTETEQQTFGKDNQSNIDKTPIKKIDVIDRYGKFWAIVDERDEYGNPVKAKPGLGEDGFAKDGAELIETIISFVLIGNHKIMIRFVPTPFIDSFGRPYKPIVRSLCYIHPTKDEGLSDGKFMRPLQVALNDTFNMSQDRVKLATLPVFKGRKYSLEDNNSVYIEPEHVIELENVDDLQELQIKDNINGALEQMQMLMGKMQQVTSIYPTTMGALPDQSSTTATAVAGAEIRTNARGNYKSLTFEYTFLIELYWLILQMTYRFADDKTITKMLGELVYFFDARPDYSYSPLSSNIETEYSKYRKLVLIDQFIGRLAGYPNPKTAKVINALLSMAFKLFENDIPPLKQKENMLDENFNPAEVQGGGPTANSIPNATMPTSNQNGAAMSPMEQMTRSGSMMSGGMM